MIARIAVNFSFACVLGFLTHATAFAGDNDVTPEIVFGDFTSNRINSRFDKRYDLATNFVEAMQIVGTWNKNSANPAEFAFLEDVIASRCKRGLFSIKDSEGKEKRLFLESAVIQFQYSMDFHGEIAKFEDSPHVSSFNEPRLLLPDISDVVHVGRNLAKRKGVTAQIYGISRERENTPESDAFQFVERWRLISDDMTMFKWNRENIGFSKITWVR